MATVDKQAHADLTRLGREHKALVREAAKIVKGRQARVVSNFNGQPYGSSRKPLTGQCLLIEGACLNDDGSVSLYTLDPRVNAGFGLADVEILAPHRETP